MPGNEFVVVQDRWSLGRRPRLRLSSSRVLPGPLKSLPRKRPAPNRATGLALTGLSLVAALAIAPQLRGAAPEPVADAVAQPAREAAPTPRIVGAAPAAVEAAPLPPPVAEGPAPAEPPVAAEPVPAAPARQAAAPVLDLGTLPVLELDAAAFEPPVVTEPAPRAGRGTAPRAAAPRLAGQP